MRVATDPTDLVAEAELPALVAVAKQAGREDPLLAECARVLEAWDGKLTADSRGATLFQAWLAQEQVGARVGVYGFLSEADLSRPPLAATAPDVAVTALSQAARWLRSSGAPLDVPWGVVHRHRRGDVDLPMDGGLDSLVPNGGYPDASGRVYATFGSSFRMLVEIGNVTSPRAWSCAPYGNSDDPASRTTRTRCARRMARLAPGPVHPRRGRGRSHGAGDACRGERPATARGALCGGPSSLGLRGLEIAWPAPHHHVVALAVAGG
jgi:acyl-homoserine lactone acylase PvdQ